MVLNTGNIVSPHRWVTSPFLHLNGHVGSVSVASLCVSMSHSRSSFLTMTEEDRGPGTSWPTQWRMPDFRKGEGVELRSIYKQKRRSRIWRIWLGPNVKRILHRGKETEARSLDPPCPPLMFKPWNHTGSVAERSKALVLGTSLLGGVGSNPTAANHFPPFLFPLWSCTHTDSWINTCTSWRQTRKNIP